MIHPHIRSKQNFYTGFTLEINELPCDLKVNLGFKLEIRNKVSSNNWFSFDFSR